MRLTGRPSVGRFDKWNLGKRPVGASADVVAVRSWRPPIPTRTYEGAPPEQGSNTNAPFFDRWPSG